MPRRNNAQSLELVRQLADALWDTLANYFDLSSSVDSVINELSTKEFEEDFSGPGFKTDEGWHGVSYNVGRYSLQVATRIIDRKTGEPNEDAHP